MACKWTFHGLVIASALVLATAYGQGDTAESQNNESEPLVLAEMGNRPFGGTVVGEPATGSLHCDHGYVDWMIPPNAREHPIVMVHASSKRTWETTFDGREGFIPIFIRRGFPVYTTDLPRTGQAGQGCGPTSYEPDIGQDQFFFEVWRLGLWPEGDPTPNFYPGVRFPVDDPEALDEFLRIQTPEFNAPENEQVETDALAELLDELGPSIMLTHSSTGIRGWITATKTDNVAAIVSYEPGTFVFPEGEAPPEPAETTFGSSGIQEIPSEDFQKLTEFPIQIVWADYIPTEPDPNPLLEFRRRRVILTHQMVDAINAHGGDAEVLSLPDIGISGNAHFPMIETNNVQIADLLSEFLQEKGLDER